MDLPFELHIALRYLLAKRKKAFISVISLISTLGVTVGVMAVIIPLPVMQGLQQELRAVPHVVGAAPAIQGLGLMRVAQEELPVQVKGIDPALEPQVTDIARAT